MGMKPCRSDGHDCSTRSRDNYTLMPVLRFYHQKKEAVTLFPANGSVQRVPNHMFLIGPCLKLLLIYSTRHAIPTPSHRKLRGKLEGGIFETHITVISRPRGKLGSANYMSPTTSPDALQNITKRLRAQTTPSRSKSAISGKIAVWAGGQVRNGAR